ncbi:MAG TPA: polysaccharide deacetylase family protein [bacterium]|nr:polysaccharide deacetylase family protein [bacterium]
MAAGTRKLHIKVDVDTYAGMRDGVPRLAEMLGRRGVTATFFVSMGPDNSGRAIRRVFTKRGFLSKMLRTKAVSVYGFPTVLYGVLLPGPQIASLNKGVFDLLRQSGHEVGVHGYDHVKWHDYVPSMTEAQVSRELDLAFRLFEETAGGRPESFAAPGWSWSAAAQRLMDKNRIVYTSNTRGSYPFFPAYGQERSSVLEIPTTLPTLDEILGVAVRDETQLTPYYLDAMKAQENAVLTIHAELEGMAYAAWFEEFLKELQGRGVVAGSLTSYAAALLQNRNDIPYCPIAPGTIPGRAGTVALQQDKR